VPPEVLADNDVLIKLSAYRLLAQTVELVGVGRPVGILGAARFVVPHVIAQHRGIKDHDGALMEWDRAFSALAVLEPTDAEIELAASIEESAASLGLAMDAGESQLCAIAVSRGIPQVVTGDKRAIASAEALRSCTSLLAPLVEALVCLEQVVAGLIEELGPDLVRESVCAEATVDRATAVCMGCSAGEAGTTFDREGLTSYINHLRLSAPSVLWRGECFPSS
jgi:hypothetical protein